MQREYEAMYIVSPTLEDENVETVITKFNDTVVKLGGSIVSVEKMGRKRLAYRVQKFSEGFYVLANFKSEPTQLDELDKICKYSDDIIRHIIINKEKK